MPINQMVSPIP
jgi:hypothetical protein